MRKPWKSRLNTLLLENEMETLDIGNGQLIGWKIVNSQQELGDFKMVSQCKLIEDDTKLLMNILYFPYL